MGWIQTGWFVALTLVAGTLPTAHGSATVADAPRPAAATAVPAPDQPTDNSRPADRPKPVTPTSADAGPMFQIAANPDKTASARSVAGNHPTSTSAGAFCLLVPNAPFNTADSASLLRTVPRQTSHTRAWLSCRYPNAPPA